MAAAAVVLSGFAALLGLAPTALWISAANFGALLLAVLLAWWKFGRDVLPVTALASAPSFICAKFPVYWRLLVRGPVAQWIRTDRK
jgi:hypothetical protein